MKKKHTAESLVASAWAAVLSTAPTLDAVPNGWLTAHQVGKLLCKSATRTGELLRAAIAQGRCERKEFRILSAGTVRPVPHYRLK